LGKTIYSFFQKNTRSPLNTGVDVKTAQQLMRRHDIKLTLDTYAQFDLEEKK